MGESVTQLWQDLSALADAFADLGREFQQAGRRLRAPGALPPEALVEEAGRLRDAFESARARACRLARRLGVEAPDPRELADLKGVAALLERATEAEERRARGAQALAVLDRVLALRHARLEEYPPLLDCQDRARALRRAIAEGPPGASADDVDGLAESDHPFAYLLAMVDGHERASDDLWQSLFESVGRAFGPTLAAAVARSRIVAPAEAEPAAIEPAPIAEADIPAETNDAPAPVDLDAPQLTLLLRPEAGGAEPDAGSEGVAAAPEALVSDEVLDSIVAEAAAHPTRGPSAPFSTRKMGRAWRRKSLPNVERLERVQLLAGNVISGSVFLDASNDGLHQPNEAPIAGNTIELLNASSHVVGSTTTDARGYYQFNADSTVDTTPKTETQTVDLGPKATNFDSTFTLPQFDPALGTLTRVDLSVSGGLTSVIRAENLSTSSPARIVADVSGQVAVDVAGVNVSAPISGPGGTFTAQAYDGTLDYAGPSGTTLTPPPASAAQTLTLSDQAGQDLSGFVGSGTVSGTFSAQADSGATGGGNLSVEADTSATATVTVKYTYTPANALAPGDYTIVQAVEPPGTLNGKFSRNGTVLPLPTSGPDEIPVHLAGADLPDNDFGELTPAGLSGFVYNDRNNDGIKQAGEPGIAGVTLLLKGTDDLGRTVDLPAQTGPTGAYNFGNLRPGTYEIDETQPAGYLDGKDTIGTPGGLTANDRFYGINLKQGVAGANNNFGELPPGSVNGYVYVDTNKDGLKEPGERGLAGVLLRLTGTDDLGQSVSLPALTDANGFYDVNGLRPGTYAVTETAAPKGYDKGQNTRGNVAPLPNSLGSYVIPGITVAPAQTAPDNDFAELTPAAPEAITIPGPTTCTMPPAEVTGVDRLGIHRQQTHFVVKFSEPLDPTTASNLANYRLVVAFRDGRVGNREIPLRSAAYNPADNTVTLTPVHRLNIHFHYLLTVSGLKDTCGQPFDGNGDGVAGGNFVTLITKHNYHHPVPAGPAAAALKTAAWAGRYPRLAAERLSHGGSGSGQVV